MLKSKNLPSTSMMIELPSLPADIPRRRWPSLAPVFRIVLASSLLISTAWAQVSEARDRHDRRQGAQRARVHDGRESGELTRGELRRVRQSGAVVRRAERRAQADGQVSESEAQRLERLQDRRSRQIHRLKHNDKQQASPVSSSGSSSGSSNEVLNEAPASESSENR